MQPTRARKLGLLLLSVLVLGTITELAAWIVEQALAKQGVIYLPATTEGYERYLEQRDPLTGWPGRTADAERDASGSRIVPGHPNPAEQSCVSLYGDSFVWGAEVAPEAAWGNLLAQRLGCRVANFGVPGFGTDQAYLRFGANDADRAPIVVLGHLSENIVRNVNQFRPLLYPPRGFGLKPRFVLAPDGSLELIPLPSPSVTEYAQLVREPAAYLPHEALLPGARGGPVRGGFPHTLAVLSTLWNQRVVAHVRGGNFWDEYYHPDHPTRALAITTAIIDAFARAAHGQGRHPVVVIFPRHHDLVARRRGREWSYQPLLQALHAHGITALNVGDSMLERGGDPSELFAGYHFNEAGNRLVADVVERLLRTEGLIGAAPAGVAAGPSRLTAASAGGQNPAP